MPDKIVHPPQFRGSPVRRRPSPDPTAPSPEVITTELALFTWICRQSKEARPTLPIDTDLIETLDELMKKLIVTSALGSDIDCSSEPGSLNQNIKCPQLAVRRYSKQHLESTLKLVIDLNNARGREISAIELCDFFLMSWRHKYRYTYVVNEESSWYICSTRDCEMHFRTQIKVPCDSSLGNGHLYRKSKAAS